MLSLSDNLSTCLYKTVQHIYEKNIRNWVYANLLRSSENNGEGLHACSVTTPVIVNRGREHPFPASIPGNILTIFRGKCLLLILITSF